MITEIFGVVFTVGNSMMFGYNLSTMMDVYFNSKKIDKLLLLALIINAIGCACGIVLIF